MGAEGSFCRLERLRVKIRQWKLLEDQTHLLAILASDLDQSLLHTSAVGTIEIGELHERDGGVGRAICRCAIVR